VESSRFRRELIRAYYRNGLPEPTDTISNQTNGERLLCCFGAEKRPKTKQTMGRYYEYFG